MRIYTKSILLITFLLLSLTNANSQDLGNLDKKFGFNKFKLESPFSLYGKQLKYKLTGYDKVKYYDYVGNDIGLIFGCIVKGISLGFYNEKLYTISIDFTLNDDEDDIRIQKSLKELFGYQKVDYSNQSSGTKYEWAVVWKTNKTYLQANKISCDNLDNPCEVAIFLFSQKLRTELQNNQF
jgi:hypothetical protein